MKSTHSILTARRIIPAFLSLVVCLSTSFTADAATPSLAEIEKKLPPIQQKVDSELSNETTLQDAQRELKQLLQNTEELLNAAGGEFKPDRAIVAVQVKILELLAKVDARLPETADDITGGSNAASLPQYSEKKLIGQAAKKLSTAHGQLTDHLRKSPADKKTGQKLLTDLIVAQEALAWEVGWPFTAEEAVAVKKAGHVPPDVYLSRRNRGVERINERLKKAAESVGREPSGKPFAIYSPTSEADQKQLDAQLIKLRGEGAKVWMKGTQPFDEKALLQPAAGR
jgi:ElaB/YqjD/DUF883 family membrane-anchored ribosome-binding protein